MWRSFLLETDVEVILRYLSNSVASKRFGSLLNDILTNDWLKDVAAQYCEHHEMKVVGVTLRTLIGILRNYVSFRFALLFRLLLN